MINTTITKIAYKKITRPILFKLDTEMVHNRYSKLGEALGNGELTKNAVSKLFAYEDKILKQRISNVKFDNPIGLAAGFDYDGHMADILKSVGFGFNTVGSVTALPYEGNTKPRLGRLPKSKSLLVNKGFKSEGAEAIAKRLTKKNLKNTTLGISVGSTNLPHINTIEKAIDDYLFTFEEFKSKSYVKYFELNISCPNTSMTESFSQKKNLKMLLKEVNSLNIVKPIFIKMPNEISNVTCANLTTLAITYSFNKFIFSNLVKDRKNKFFDRAEIKKIRSKGNFSGKPTEENANRLIASTRKKHGKDVIIIGCGGVFSAEDAYTKIKLGADLIQLITGMVFEGPQLIGEINLGLSKMLRKDGYKNVSEAIGADLKN